MNLSQQIQNALAYISAIETPATQSPQEAGRAFYEKFAPLAGTKENVFLVEDTTLVHHHHTVPIRIYRPHDKSDLPVIIYFHGGWFNAGSLETHDTPLRALSNLADAVIVSVAYRLAPEHPFPAGLSDCELAVQWTIAHAVSLRINPDKIIIAGDSAGGALAATVTRKNRAQIRAQLLIYPVTDHTLTTPSWITYQNGPLLTLEGGRQAWDWYLPKEQDHCNPDAVPLLADDLDALPPTFIAVAAYDPLKDEALRYAQKLEAHNVNVTLAMYSGVTHGFFQMGGYIPDTRKLLHDMVQFIQQS